MMSSACSSATKLTTSSVFLIFSSLIFVTKTFGHVDDFAERHSQETDCGLPFPDPLNNRRTFITFRNQYNRQNLTVVASDDRYGMQLVTTRRPADGRNRDLIHRQLFIEQGDEAYLRSLLRCSGIEGQGHNRAVVTAPYDAMNRMQQRWVFVNGPNWITNSDIGADDGTDFCLALARPFTADNNVVVAVNGCYPGSLSAKWEPIFSYEE